MVNLLVFLILIFIGTGLAIWKGPFYALLVYVVVYFTPFAKYNWWLLEFPFNRWSMLASVILMVSLIMHRDKIGKRKWYSAKWIYVFLAVAAIGIATTDVRHDDIYGYGYRLVTYAVTVFFIIRAIVTKEQYQVFLLVLVCLASYLGVKAVTVGKRVHARLENIGTLDTIGSNEFGILLGGVIPFVIPFLFYGKRYEKIICIIATPLLLNAMVLCNSRGAFVGFGFGVVFAFLFAGDAKIRKYIFFGLACGIPLFIYLADEEFVNRISSLWQTQEAFEDEEMAGQLSSGRTIVWKHGIDMVNDYPLGAGPNSFKNIARFYIPEEMLTNHVGAAYGVRAAHNTYLQVLVEQGYLGLFVWITMCTHSMYLLIKCVYILKGIGLSQTFLGFSAVALNMSLTCSIMGGIFNSRIYYEFFWWQIALSALVYSLVLDVAKDVQSKGTIHIDGGDCKP